MSSTDRDAVSPARAGGVARNQHQEATVTRPSTHHPITKSYAIDQIEDIEHLRRVAHRMWEAFNAAHKQHAHTIGALLYGKCAPCYGVMHGDRDTACVEYQELQRKVSDGFGSV